MKNKQLLINLMLLIIIASLYRIIPSRPYGFSPMIAMALFGGAVIEDKKFAFLLPVLSMFLSDALYQLMYINGIGQISGFYDGQAINYISLSSLTIFGFIIKKGGLKNFLVACISAPTVYFLISNFLVWASSSPLAGLNRPKTLAGLMMCYGDGLPFYPWSLISTIVFSVILFGAYHVTKNKKTLFSF